MKRTKNRVVLPDVYIYGKINSGKDTIANYLTSTHHYANFKMAGTIKQLICEELNICPEQLEKLKNGTDTSHEIRQKHHVISNLIKSEIYSLHRLEQIIKRCNFDAINIEKSRPRVVSDIRTLDEVRVMSKHINTPCMFLLFNRISPAQKHKNLYNKHWSDIDILEKENRKILVDLISNNPNIHPYVILNEECKNINTISEQDKGIFTYVELSKTNPFLTLVTEFKTLFLKFINNQ